MKRVDGGVVLTILILLLAFAAAVGLYISRYNDCMEKRHDEMFCQVYARSGF